MCTNLLGALGRQCRRHRATHRARHGRPLADRAADRLEAGTRLENLHLYSDINGNYSRDYHGVLPDGSEIPSLNVFTRRDGTIRHFWSGEMTGDAADPGQDPRGAPDLAPLWNVLDMTPEGRGPTGIRNWITRLDVPAGYGHAGRSRSYASAPRFGDPWCWVMRQLPPCLTRTQVIR